MVNIAISNGENIPITNVWSEVAWNTWENVANLLDLNTEFIKYINSSSLNAYILESIKTNKYKKLSEITIKDKNSGRTTIIKISSYSTSLVKNFTDDEDSSFYAIKNLSIKGLKTKNADLEKILKEILSTYHKFLDNFNKN